MAIKSLARSTIRQAQRGNSALAGYESNYFHHLETVRLGGNASSVELTNLARYNDFQHFQIRLVTRTNRAANEDPLGIRFNGDSGNNYVTHLLYGSGSSVASATSIPGGPFNYLIPAYVGAANNTANAFSGLVIDILDPFETAKNKTVRCLWATPAGNLVGIDSGLWMSGAAITSITLFPGIGSALLQGSRFSLYGLKARA